MHFKSSQQSKIVSSWRLTFSYSFKKKAFISLALLFAKFSSSHDGVDNFNYFLFLPASLNHVILGSHNMGQHVYEYIHKI